MARRPLLLLVVLALAGSGCGGGGGDPAPDRPRAATPRPEEPQASPRGDAEEEPTGPVTDGEEAVIRGWADALRRGDVERAISFWQVPSLASNGGPPIRLVTRRAVRFFNEGLTCGARLLSVRREARYVLATFRLTERRGMEACGSGVGERARTLFLLRDGHIVQWLRAMDPLSAPETPGGTES
jgi:hypothetical protein